MILIAIIISTLLYYASSNVCRYNFTIEKKTNQLNLIAEGITPAIPLTEVYYFKELNCNIQIKFDKSKPNGTPRKLIDSSLANSHGWKAKVSLKDGFLKTYNDFLKNYT